MKKMIISAEYLNYINIFSKKLAIMKLSKRFFINKYTINTKNDK